MCTACRSPFGARRCVGGARWVVGGGWCAERDILADAAGSIRQRRPRHFNTHGKLQLVLLPTAPCHAVLPPPLLTPAHPDACAALVARVAAVLLLAACARLHLRYARDLDENDLFHLPPWMTTAHLSSKLEAHFSRCVASGSRNPLASALLATTRRRATLGTSCFVAEMFIAMGMCVVRTWPGGKLFAECESFSPPLASKHRKMCGEAHVPDSTAVHKRWAGVVMPLHRCSTAFCTASRPARHLPTSTRWRACTPHWR